MRTRTLSELPFASLAVNRDFVFDSDKNGLGIVVSLRVLTNFLNGGDISIRGIPSVMLRLVRN